MKQTHDLDLDLNLLHAYPGQEHEDGDEDREPELLRAEQAACGGVPGLGVGIVGVAHDDLLGRSAPLEFETQQSAADVRKPK